mgnify:FL=1
MHSEWTKKVQISALARTTDLCTNNQTKCHDINDDPGTISGVVVFLHYMSKNFRFLSIFTFFYDKKGLSLGWVYGMIGKELSGVKGIK